MKKHFFLYLVLISLPCFSQDVQDASKTAETNTEVHKEVHVEQSKKMHKRLKGEIALPQKVSKCAADDDACLKNEAHEEKKLIKENLKGTNR